MLIRTIGIALWPAILFSLIGRLSVYKKFSFISKGHNRILLTSLLLVLSLLIIMLANVKYVHEAYKAYRLICGSILSGIIIVLRYRTEELGELAVNFPLTRISGNISWFLIIIGSIVFMCIIRGIWLRRKDYGVVDYFFITFMGLLLFWPYQDARFWLPIVPLGMCFIARGIGGIGKANFLKRAITVYLVMFVVLGLGVFAHTTRVSFSGSNYPNLLNNKLYYNEYRIAISENNPEMIAKADQYALHVLEKYGGFKKKGK